MISMCETSKTTTLTTTNNQQPTPSYQQQATSNQQQTSNNQQPTANNQQEKQQYQFQTMSMLKLQTIVRWKWEIAQALYADVCSCVCVCVCGMSVCFSVCFAGWPWGCLFRLYLLATSSFVRSLFGFRRCLCDGAPHELAAHTCMYS